MRWPVGGIVKLRKTQLIDPQDSALESHRPPGILCVGLGQSTQLDSALLRCGGAKPLEGATHLFQAGVDFLTVSRCFHGLQHSSRHSRFS